MEKEKISKEETTLSGPQEIQRPDHLSASPSSEDRTPQESGPSANAESPSESGSPAEPEGERLVRMTQDRIREVEAANLELKENEESRNRFLAQMSHDLKTPLNAIIGFTEVVLSGIDGPLTDLQTKDLNFIFENGKYLLKLVRDIGSGSGIEAGKAGGEGFNPRDEGKGSIDGLKTDQEEEIGKKILYIEDNPSNRILVRRALQSAGHRVIEAPDGMSGIEVASREVPDLILMDIDLPDMDGYEVATKIKNSIQLDHIPIVALTAYTEDGDRERAITAGCDGYITKPINVHTFPTRVSEFLSGKREAVGGKEESYYLKEHSRKLVDRLESKVRELVQANDKLRDLNEDLSDRNRELILANRERRNMVDIIGHEFKSPLSTIKGYLQLMKKKSVQPKDQERVVSVMMERVDSLNQMVSDITSLTMKDRSYLNARRDSMSGLFSMVHDEFSRFGNNRGHTIDLKLPKEEVYCDFDRDRMYKVYANLIGNAIKFTPDGGRITIGLEVKGKEVITYVEDSGIGIDPAYKEWIWKPFKSTDNSLRHHTAQGYDFQGGGIGIGLALAKHIVELHGGRIEVESEGVGQGSKFIVVLKQKIDPPTETQP